MIEHKLYNLNYYEEMLRRNSKTAERIVNIRWKFISLLNPQIVLDYGSGVGWFRAYRPQDVEVDTYDVGRYPQTGILHKNYDIICLWDVLEHLHSLSEIENLLKKTHFIALSVPIKPEDKPLKRWKHFKPGEHLNYFTEQSLDEAFLRYSFRSIVKAHPECPPRQDILSAIYERVKVR